MFKKKDFIFMDVLDTKGKRIGYINDILINCHIGEVTGFKITSKKLLMKRVNVLKSDIVYYNNNMIIKTISNCECLGFSEINNMDVIDNNGNIIGMVEDIIFQQDSFKIYALIVTTGFLKSYIVGKRVIMIKDIIFGEKNLIMHNCHNKFKFYCKPNIGIKGIDVYEKNSL